MFSGLKKTKFSSEFHRDLYLNFWPVRASSGSDIYSMWLPIFASNASSAHIHGDQTWSFEKRGPIQYNNCLTNKRIHVIKFMGILMPGKTVFIFIQAFWGWLNSLAHGKFEWNFRHVIFKQILSDWWLRHLLWNCTNVNVTGLHWWSINIGSGNGLVPSGNKPLPEPMLTQIYVAIWRH